MSSGEEAASNSEEKPKFWKLKYFLGGVLFLDGLSSLILLSPVIGFILKAAGETEGSYSFYGSLYDLAILAALRITAALLGLGIAYLRAHVPPEFPFGLYHPNGDKKSREELEQEALEEDFCPWLIRFLSRPSFPTELLSVVTQVACISKCMYRMYKEIGTYYDTEPYHPLFWIAVLLTTVLSVLEANYTESMCRLAGQYGKINRPRLLRSISSTLSIPLLNSNDDNAEEGGDEVEELDVENQVGQSEIGPDANYKAGWTDLLKSCFPDIHLLCCAFVFLVLAAIAQVYIPRFLGHILDSLTATFADADDDATSHKTMSDIPGFVRNVQLLVVASLAAGIFSGLRGSIFTVVGARVNVRLRVMLMDSLLSQDIGFFDVTKTGDITSRLSSDTTLVGDQVSLNVNVFLRSLVQAIGVLLFMFVVSWQLTIIAFISVPLVTVISKWYGEFLRSLVKLMQKKLADGNSVSEAAISAMPTVRSFDAAESELKEFEEHMQQYLKFNNRSALAYSGYAAFTTAVPQLVYAVVVFYGGLLVRNGDMTSGGLVSFLLYLTSLSDAFSSIGYVYSSLTQAVGAADKVFELMHRQPRYKRPSSMGDSDETTHRTPVLGIHAPMTRALRARGIKPPSMRGEIKFEDVDLFYPARPNRKVLDKLSLHIEAGSVVALVGQSGGGKSSCMALIQHLYEQRSGKVMIDDTEVHEICHEWLCRNISIVSQEPTLFGRSVRSNIIYGLEGTEYEPTQEQIEEAARLANADSFIQKMPQKYETSVGERGVQLSGGQRQRLAIARALVRKPKILLLDEATSALDAESEHLVQEAIDNMLARGKDGENGGSMTVLIVAHRLSTVRNSDKIFVINEGKVVEEGSHNDLLSNPDGAYTSLIKRQMNAQSKLENNSSSSSSSSIEKSNSN